MLIHPVGQALKVQALIYNTQPNIVFVDSSGWIALVNNRDSLHDQARQVYLDKLKSGARLLTTTAVLLEVGNWLSPSNLRTLALDLLDKIEASSLIEVTYVDSNLYDAGWELFLEQSDKDWGVTGCMSFVVMRERRIVEALSADHHFQQAGFVKLL